MKKKIKDLTLEECENICIKHGCEDCPLDIPHSNTCHFIGLQRGLRLPINAEIEVEVDE